MRMLAVIVIPLLVALALVGDEDYELGPDSMRQEGVPLGTVTRRVWHSRVFPETVRDYWVFVPEQYDGTKPACVMVCQDGIVYAGCGVIRNQNPTQSDRLPPMAESVFQRVKNLLIEHGTAFDVPRHEPVEKRYGRRHLPDCLSLQRLAT